MAAKDGFKFFLKVLVQMQDDIWCGPLMWMEKLLMVLVGRVRLRCPQMVTIQFLIVILMAMETLLSEPSDWDDNGIIDGSENTAYSFYELHNGGIPIELTSTRGKTFNHASNRNWDAVQAVTHDSHDGFLVLLEGTNKRAGKFYVWGY